jgi:hypothetical protein
MSDFNAGFELSVLVIPGGRERNPFRADRRAFHSVLQFVINLPAGGYLCDVLTCHCFLSLRARPSTAGTAARGPQEPPLADAAPALLSTASPGRTHWVTQGASAAAHARFLASFHLAPQVPPGGPNAVTPLPICVYYLFRVVPDPLEIFDASAG